MIRRRSMGDPVTEGRWLWQRAVPSVVARCRLIKCGGNAGFENQCFATKDWIRKRWSWVLNLGGKLDKKQTVSIVFKCLPSRLFISCKEIKRNHTADKSDRSLPGSSDITLLGRGMWAPCALDTEPGGDASAACHCGWKRAAH